MVNTKTWQPHPTHKMGEWRNTIITLIVTSRFGSIRKCEYCKAEHAKTVAGERHHQELDSPCLESPEILVEQ